MTTTSRPFSQTATLDRTPLYWAAYALLALLALIWFLSAPVPMTVVYVAAALLVIIQRTHLLTDQPSTFIGGAFGLAVVLIATSLLLETAPPLIFITGWIVWGTFGVAITMFAFCFFAGISRILLPVETAQRSPALFWAGVTLILLSYVAVALYFTYIRI